MMLKLKATLLASTTLLILATKKERICSDISLLLIAKDMSLKAIYLLDNLLPLTGELLVLSPQLKIKANVDHAGHSPQLGPSKELTNLRTKISYHSQNNNWLIAQP
jgi:hypothetical protein